MNRDNNRRPARRYNNTERPSDIGRNKADARNNIETDHKNEGPLSRLFEDISYSFSRMFKRNDDDLRRYLDNDASNHNQHGNAPDGMNDHNNDFDNPDTDNGIDQQGTGRHGQYLPVLGEVGSFMRKAKDRMFRKSEHTEPKNEESTMLFKPVKNNQENTESAANRRTGVFGSLLTIFKPAENESGHNISIFKPRARHRSFLASVLLSFVSLLLVFMFVFGISGIGAMLGIINAYVDTTPVLDLTKIENQDESSFIYDCNGELITTFTGLENRIWETLDNIPVMLQNAFIAMEDERFYSHNGIDIKRIAGAFFNNLRTDTTQGGSTITQQLIKLRLLSYEQTYKRKLQEAYLAIQLEERYSKEQILEAYLNTIELGSSNYGVKAAARDYFGKELNELTLRECAMLAGVANSAYLYNPRTNRYIRNSTRTEKRTDLVLYNMYKCGYITKDEYNSALVEQVNIIEESKTHQMYDMPYFLEYSIYDVVTQLLKQRNMTDTSTNRAVIENELRTSGYHIYTTVDPVIQSIVETTLYNWDKYPLTRYESDAYVEIQNSDGTTQKLAQPQSAAVVFDHNTGQLKAIVGGRQDPTVKKALNRAYQSHMPVGSSIKPLAVYGPALENGATTLTTLLNIPGAIEGWNTALGYPNNYGGTFSGTVTVRNALINSINVAAARLLVDYAGIDESYNTLIDLGVTPSSINKDGAGLSLGTSGISPLEMAVAFGAIANSGVYKEPVSFTEVLDASGNVLIDSNAYAINIPVFTPQTAWLLVDMLEDAVSSGTGRNARISGMTVAGKTGTNSDYRGVFFAGITPYYSAAVWVGHDNYKPLYKGAQGGRDAAPLWKAFMEEIHAKYSLENKDIIEDSASSLGLVRATACSMTGLQATDACRLDTEFYPPVTDWVPSDRTPSEPCNIHRILKYCSETGKIATPYCQSTYEKSVLAIPPDSIINELSIEQRAEYYPNAIFGLPEDLSQFTVDNPLYTGYFCQLHTQDWYNTNVLLENAKNSANQLITNVQSMMLQYAANISGDVSFQINSAILDLQAAMLSNDVQQINSKYTILNNLKAAYLDPLVQTTPGGDGG